MKPVLSSPCLTWNRKKLDIQVFNTGDFLDNTAGCLTELLDKSHDVFWLLKTQSLSIFPSRWAHQVGVAGTILSKVWEGAFIQVLTHWEFLLTEFLRRCSQDSQTAAVAGLYGDTDSPAEEIACMPLTHTVWTSGNYSTPWTSLPYRLSGWSTPFCHRNSPDRFVSAENTINWFINCVSTAIKSTKDLEKHDARAQSKLWCCRWFYLSLSLTNVYSFFIPIFFSSKKCQKFLSREALNVHFGNIPLTYRKMCM